ncbi:MAG: alpha amylase C-terminal domain-containing protein [Clostridiaceae bacterium]|nr:alpha amylase C-terminal domain-containing protein [Clostridiaceae bacterium]
MFHEKKDGALLLAEPPSAWAGVTSLPDDGGLGFDMVWNKSWYHEFSRYIRLNPLFRKGCHEALISNMLYTYSENRIMVFPHDELAGCKQTLLAMMPGEEEEKYANVRVAFGYLMTHPGKKLHFMGQEFGQTEGWRFGQTVAWEECEKEAHSRLCQYVKKLNFFYRNHPALYECDYSRNGFEWISCLDAEHSIIVFLRRDKKEKETLLVVCNFTPVTYENFKVGVPFAGTYHEIFNSDKEEFGGSGCENRKNIVSREVLWDGRENAITIDVAPLGISIFSCAAEKNGDVQ